MLRPFGHWLGVTGSQSVVRTVRAGTAVAASLYPHDAAAARFPWSPRTDDACTMQVPSSSMGFPAFIPVRMRTGTSEAANFS